MVAFLITWEKEEKAGNFDHIQKYFSNVKHTYVFMMEKLQIRSYTVSQPMNSELSWQFVERGDPRVQRK